MATRGSVDVWEKRVSVGKRHSKRLYRSGNIKCTHCFIATYDSVDVCEEECLCGEGNGKDAIELVNKWNMLSLKKRMTICDEVQSAKHEKVWRKTGKRLSGSKRV